MSAPIEFYFDFSSPYGYLGAQRIEGIAEKHGRTTVWKPFLMGAVFKEIGTKPLADIPLKGDYLRIDMPRSARELGVPYKTPETFPFASVAACRGSYWAMDRDPAAAKALMQALYRRAFGEGREITSPAAVAVVAESVGLPREELLAALDSPEVKERLRSEVAAAMRKGVFGSPYVIVDGEPFWGNDRMASVDRWLATGGW